MSDSSEAGISFVATNKLHNVNCASGVTGGCLRLHAVLVYRTCSSFCFRGFSHQLFGCQGFQMWGLSCTIIINVYVWWWWLTNQKSWWITLSFHSLDVLLLRQSFTQVLPQGRRVGRRISDKEHRVFITLAFMVDMVNSGWDQSSRFKLRKTVKEQT